MPYDPGAAKYGFIRYAAGATTTPPAAACARTAAGAAASARIVTTSQPPRRRRIIGMLLSLRSSIAFNHLYCTRRPCRPTQPPWKARFLVTQNKDLSPAELLLQFA